MYQVMSKVIIFCIFFVAVKSSMVTLADGAVSNEIATNGTGRRCYICNSAYDKGCEDLEKKDTHSPYYKPCLDYEDKNATIRDYFCRKVTQTVTNPTTNEEEKRVIRKCGWVKHDVDKKCYKVTNPAHKEIVCMCEEDACNSAPDTLLSFSLLSISLAVATLAKIIR